jgi:hypothetical protein
MRAFGSITERNGQWVVRWSVTGKDGKRHQPSRQFTSQEEAESFISELRGQKPKNPRPFWMKSDREWLDAILPELQRLREENRRLRQDLDDERGMNLTRALRVYLGMQAGPYIVEKDPERFDPIAGKKRNEERLRHAVAAIKKAGDSGLRSKDLLRIADVSKGSSSTKLYEALRKVPEIEYRSIYHTWHWVDN